MIQNFARDRIRIQLGLQLGLQDKAGLFLNFNFFSDVKIHSGRKKKKKL